MISRGYTLAPNHLSPWRLPLTLMRTALAKNATLFTTDYAAPAVCICPEVDIPQLGRRGDTVVVTPAAVGLIELQAVARKFDPLAYEHAWEYRREVKTFDAPSHATLHDCRQRPCSGIPYSGRRTLDTLHRSMQCQPLAKA